MGVKKKTDSSTVQTGGRLEVNTDIREQRGHGGRYTQVGEDALQAVDESGQSGGKATEDAAKEITDEGQDGAEKRSDDCTGQRRVSGSISYEGVGDIHKVANEPCKVSILGGGGGVEHGTKSGESELKTLVSG